MDIDMKELEAFSGVVEKGSFSKAAEQLYLTQPTISAHIASLERKLGVRLLVRTTKEIYPSEAGKLLYEYAREILRLRSDAVQSIRALSGEVRGSLTICAAAAPARSLLPSLMRDFRASYPYVRFILRVTDSAAVCSDVSARDADLGFTDLPPRHPKCVFDRIAQDRLVLAVPNLPRYRALIADCSPAQLLLEQPLILCDDGSELRAQTDALLQSLAPGADAPFIAAETSSLHDMLSLVYARVGLAILPARVCEDDPRILTVSLDAAPARSYCLVRRKSGTLSPIARLFYDFVTGACP